MTKLKYPPRDAQCWRCNNVYVVEVEQDWRVLCDSCEQAAKEASDLLNRLANEQSDIKLRGCLRRAAKFPPSPGLDCTLAAIIVGNELQAAALVRDTLHWHQARAPLSFREAWKYNSFRAALRKLLSQIIGTCG